MTHIGLHVSEYTCLFVYTQIVNLLLNKLTCLTTSLLTYMFFSVKVILILYHYITFQMYHWQILTSEHAKVDARTERVKLSSPTKFIVGVYLLKHETG